jgi:micrococcal nuclease
MYEYTGKVTRVVDGDTLHVDIDLGCDTHLNMTIRLDGIDAPEMSTSEGHLARDYVVAWLEQFGNQVVVRTVKDKKEKYGRYLAWIWPPNIMDRPGDNSLQDDMLARGYAKPYAGGKRDV